jgi:DNA-binding response OmpR family regulator
MKLVLIVEDTPDLGRLLVAAIATIGPEIKAEVMPSAEEAFMELTRHPADILVTDIRLPGMSGTELIRKVHTRFPDMKIVVMTGLSDPVYRDETLKAGADVFFTKPLEMGEFLDSIRRLLTVTSPPPAAAKPPPEPSPAQLSETLAGLRERLGAAAVILIDERGRVVAQAGSLPVASFESDWSPALLSAASGGLQMAHLIGENPVEGVLVFRGPKLDLVLAPVATYALLLSLPAGRKALRLPIAIDETLETQKELQAALKEMGLQPQPGRESPVSITGGFPPAPFPASSLVTRPAAEPEVDPAVLEQLSALLSQGSSVPHLADLDSFWDSASSKNSTGPADPGTLSYEQAVKLGLTPGGSEN